jgi:protein-S-isoprenylcysteine O-methyltransferase Ste14
VNAARRPRWLWFRVLSFTLILPGLILAYAPYFLIITPRRVADGWPPGAARVPALVPMAIGIVVYVACAWRFATEGLGTPAPYDPPRRLVTGGLYRWSRNPMYVGITLALLGEAWLFASPSQAVYAAMVALAFRLRVTLYEEPRLRERYGEEYAQFRERVRRWL